MWGITGRPLKLKAPSWACPSPPAHALQLTASNEHGAHGPVALSEPVVVGLPDAPTLPADAVTADVGKITLKWTAPQTNDFIGTKWVAGRGGGAIHMGQALRLQRCSGDLQAVLLCTSASKRLPPPPSSTGTPPCCTAPPTSQPPSSAWPSPPLAPSTLASPDSKRLWPCRPALTNWRLPPPMCTATAAKPDQPPPSPLVRGHAHLHKGDGCSCCHQPPSACAAARQAAASH